MTFSRYSIVDTVHDIFSFSHCSELQESIGATKATLDAVYGDAVMNATPYHLHAVLVHQGQASGGHYWAYIRRLCNPYRKRRQPRGSGSHDQSHDPLDQPPALDTDVVLESQPESEEQGAVLNDSLETHADVSPPTCQTSGEDSLQTSQTGQTSSLGRTDSIESDNMSEGGQTHGTTNRTHKASSTGFRPSEGMDVDRGGVGVSSTDGRGDEEVWLKFNDVSVSMVGWEEVLRESLGGRQNNTSAYCLIYVSEALHLQMKQGRYLKYIVSFTF